MQSVRLEIDYKIPSLNALFAMNHWGRTREKKKAQSALSSALRRSGHASSTLTICAPNTSLTQHDTCDSSKTIRQRTSSSKSFNKKFRKLIKKPSSK